MLAMRLAGVGAGFRRIAALFVTRFGCTDYGKGTECGLPQELNNA